MQRFRKSGDGNREKDPGKKSEYFAQLLEAYKELLENGYNPLDEKSNAKLKKSIISITLSEGKELFQEYHKSKGTRKKSIQTYLSKVNAFIAHYGENMKVNEITDYEITAFLNHQEATLGWLGVTYVNAKIALNNFFKYLKVNKYIPLNPVTDTETRKKVRTSSHEVFSAEDFKLIIGWLTEHDAYTLLFCQALYYTCIRPKELRYLQLKHINMAEATITVPASISKNKLAQPVFIDGSLMVELKKLNLTSYSQDYFLFGSTTNIVGPTHIGENTPYTRFRKCLVALKLDDKDYTLYALKHFSNVSKRKAGWTFDDIARANRHSSIAETETYLKHLMKYAPNDKVIPPI
jgi:integrase